MGVNYLPDSEGGGTKRKREETRLGLVTGKETRKKSDNTMEK